MDVFVNDMSMFLPHTAVNNNEIEAVLGKINGVPVPGKAAGVKK